MNNGTATRGDFNSQRDNLSTSPRATSAWTWRSGPTPRY